MLKIKPAPLSVSLMLAIGLALAGCASTSGDSHVNTISFPDPDSAWPKDGTYPNVDNLRSIAQGMTKDQIVALVGTPHNSEGFGAREWDYLFWLPNSRNSNYQRCQYKLVYGSESVVSSSYWNPESCRSLLARPAPPAPVVIAPPPPPPAPVVLPPVITLEGDALFKLGRGDLQGMLPNAKPRLDSLVSTVASARSVKSLTVVGHTDRLGSPAKNTVLSQQRAETIMNYMRANGVSVPMKALGAGSSAPLVECPGRTSQAVIDCLQPNRRVEIRVEDIKH